jgi:hypothetical protein
MKEESMACCSNPKRRREKGGSWLFPSWLDALKYEPSAADCDTGADIHIEENRVHPIAGAVNIEVANL